MKKLFFIAAMAGAALVGCTKNEPAQVAQQEITFAAPVVSPQTKAAQEVHNNYPTAESFAVWAHYYDDVYTNFDAGKVYMNETEVSYDGTTSCWKKAGYYWPKNGSLTFIAYAPSSVASYAEVGATGIKFNNYSVSTNAAEQVDLLFSERSYDKTAVDDNAQGGSYETGESPSQVYDPYTGVHISFKHALSSILFTVKLKEAYTGTKITLKKIDLTNIKSTGTFNQGLADDPASVTTADADLWTGEDTPETYSVEANQLLDTDMWYTCNPSKNAPAIASGKRATDWILLPQEIAADAKMVVTYTIQSPDSEALTQTLDVDLKGQVAEWKWGYRYIYNIVIGLDEIYFEPYVAPWTDATELAPAI